MLLRGNLGRWDGEDGVPQLGAGDAVVSLLLPQFLSSSHGKGAGRGILGAEEQSVGSYQQERA